MKNIITNSAKTLLKQKLSEAENNLFSQELIKRNIHL